MINYNLKYINKNVGEYKTFYIYLGVDVILYKEKNYIKIFEIFRIYIKENIILFIINIDKYTIAINCSFEILLFIFWLVV